MMGLPNYISTLRLTIFLKIWIHTDEYGFYNMGAVSNYD
jgi:hypothetical protein